MSALSRLRIADLLPVATIGLRTRPGRAALSVLGVAIGIAAMVAVLGVTRSSQAQVLAQLDRLGTNLLTVTNAEARGSRENQLPETAASSIGRTEGVRSAAATAQLKDVGVHRTDKIPSHLGAGLEVRASGTGLLSTLDAHLIEGVFLDPATSNYPVVVLGFEAARTMGITEVTGDERIWLGERWYVVTGILQQVQLAPEIDRAALIGFGTATADFGYDGHPSRVYVRADTDRTAEVATMLPRAANPAAPSRVTVSRPSDVLSARLAVADATTSLFLGLGAVALLVGGIGIANVMVISVLERRGEVGLRRALGAARRHVAAQFVVESVLLGAVGGGAGVLLGAAVTVALAHHQGWQPIIPPVAAGLGLVAAIGVGTVAGLYPALRAARMAPTEALRTA
ncbi:ABC transporter permease [Actinoplanes sp. NEAU-A12]|uniref:ABC transporter permease n=1 Tax=Actinoplanes sandaracinus TaxID=3045177 RepID=A0ABT6WMW0_9ACTN|nr:ABC transporter permease [Actinoplanes sandaracinus]MDI6101064.1 ABC transporter permease [Actinoplanes sandaracinus]